MLSRRTSLPLLFLQSATLNWRPLLYIPRIPAYNTLNATRDATLTKITLVTNRELNRDERSFSREFTLRRYIILNDYIRCEGGYLSSNRILSFFFLPLLSQFSQPDSLLFCSSITGNATCKSPMRIPARQPYTVNTRKNMHACKSGGAARMRGTHAPTACNPQSKYMGQTPPSACVGVLQPPTTIPTIQPHIHTANPLDYEDTSRRTSPLINTRRPGIPSFVSSSLDQFSASSTAFIVARWEIRFFVFAPLFHEYCTMTIFNFFLFSKKMKIIGIIKLLEIFLIAFQKN